MDKHKKISRITASLLVVITMISIIPLQAAKAYTGWGDGYTGTLQGGNSYYSFSTSLTGIRVSIVDQDGNNHIIRNGKNTVIDIMFSKPHMTNSGRFKTNKFGSGEQCEVVNAEEIRTAIAEAIETDKGQTYTGIDTQIVNGKVQHIEEFPKPIEWGGGGAVGNGAEVKQWFIRGDLESFVKQTRTPLFTGISLGKSDLTKYFDIVRKVDDAEASRMVATLGPDTNIELRYHAGTKNMYQKAVVYVKKHYINGRYYGNN